MDAAPIVVPEPVHIEVLLPALVVGKGFTVMIAEFELVQPVAVIFSVRVYVVVTVGETDGFEAVLIKPEGDETHE